MIADALGLLGDVAFLLELARVVLSVTVAWVAIKVIMDAWVRRAKGAGRETPLFVVAFRGPVYGAIMLLGLIEFAVVLLEKLHTQWVPGLRTVQGIVFLALIFVMLYRLVTVVEQKMLEREARKPKRGDGLDIDSGAIRGIGHTLKGIVLVVAALTVMSTLGVKIEGILAFGGVGTILIGFMARETLANYFSGMMIFMDRPFSVGDWIRIPSAEIEGTVESVGWRITCVRTFDQRPLYVPNGMLSDAVIENPQRMLNRRIYEYMGLRYDDIKVMPAVIEDVRRLLQESPEIDQDKTVMVNFDRYGSSSLDFFVYAMTRTTDWTRFHQVKQEILLGIAEIVEKHGAEFAFPTRTLLNHYPDGPAAPSSAR